MSKNSKNINNTVPTDMYEESIKGKKFACDTYTA